MKFPNLPRSGCFVSFLILLLLTPQPSAFAGKKSRKKLTSSSPAPSGSNRFFCRRNFLILGGLGTVGAGFGIYYFGFSGNQQDDSQISPVEQWKKRRKSEGLELPESIKINVLGQMHAPHDISSVEALNLQITAAQKSKIFTSQANILLKLSEFQKKEPILIFSEGLEEDWDQELLKNILAAIPKNREMTDQEFKDLSRRFDSIAVAVVDNTIRLFPNGIPNYEFNRWNQGQKGTLLTFGADRIMWALGLIDTIYAASSKDVDAKAKATMTQTGWDGSPPAADSKGLKIRQDIFTSREIEALVRIHKVSKNQPNRPIFLIFGASHDFKQYEDSKLQITPTLTFTP